MPRKYELRLGETPSLEKKAEDDEMAPLSRTKTLLKCNI
jgi:hypothetical protein